MSLVFTWTATVIALVGTILNCKQIRSCFYLWIATNAMWFIWDAYSGLWSRCVLDAVQFVLAIYGVYEWRKLDKEKNNAD